MTQNQEWIENNFHGKRVMYGGFALLYHSLLDENSLFALEKPADWSYDCFSLVKNDVSTLWLAISVFSLVKKKPCRSLAASLFFRKMASNQTNRSQSLDSSVRRLHRRTGKWKHQEKDQTRCCSVPRISCFERRDEKNGRIDSSRAEQVSQRVPYHGSQKRRQRGIF